MRPAPYAMRESESRGRRHPELPHPYRSEYQRDRDRVIHSRAFRRLENKTQVFEPDVSDHFRNRLTHSIEVSQIARTVGAQLGLNVDLCEALALSHDVGHSPFSHTGERVLDSLMRERGGFFDHNIHALRIFETFEEKYPDFPGLNLTFELREGIVKHSRDYQPNDPLRAELHEYLLDELPPLEAQLIDPVDELAYNTADLDDGYESKLLTMEMLVEEIPLFGRFFRKTQAHRPGAPEKLNFNVALRDTLNALVTDLIDSSRRRLEGTAIQSVADVRRLGSRLIRLGVLEEDNRVTKDFLTRRLYSHEQITSGRREAEQVLRGLFEFYCAEPARLPGNHYAKVRERDLPVFRVVCDYLAGMTDDYIRRKYQEHFRSAAVRP